MQKPDEIREVAQKYDTSVVRLTYEDYCRMPAGLRYELVEGDLRMTPSPDVFHQKISKRLQRVLLEWIEDRGLGEVYDAPLDVVLSNHNVVQPDLLYVAKERLGIIKESNIQGPPDLVVEILSDSSVEWDRVTKRQVYAKYGVRELWLVDPKGRTIEVATLQGHELATFQVYPTGTILNSPLLPGLTLNVTRSSGPGQNSAISGHRGSALPDESTW
ncbi:MAG: Uma2 family endonuclease [Firmicutes bacterium]|nr:Uma2 family endonuclease [Bacillota bacterium]